MPTKTCEKSAATTPLLTCSCDHDEQLGPNRLVRVVSVHILEQICRSAGQNGPEQGEHQRRSHAQGDFPVLVAMRATKRLLVEFRELSDRPTEGILAGPISEDNYMEVWGHARTPRRPFFSE